MTVGKPDQCEDGVVEQIADGHQDEPLRVSLRLARDLTLPLGRLAAVFIGTTNPLRYGNLVQRAGVFGGFQPS